MQGIIFIATWFSGSILLAAAVGSFVHTDGLPLSRPRKAIVVGLLALWLTIVICYAAFICPAFAHDSGQWPDGDLKQWYQSLMQPDVPTASCCGEADAYFADEIHVRNGKTYVTVTDDRADEPRGRPHIAIGTEIEVPPNKLKFDRGNPTGHGILFVSKGGFVFCYVQPGGA